METTLREAQRTLVAIVLAYVEAILRSVNKPSTGLRLSRQMDRAINRHYRYQNKIFQIVLRERLAARPVMRAQVCADLGGKIAMVRWERRRRCGGRLSVSSGEPQHFNVSSERGRQRKAPQKRWIPQTDRHGHFRMAPIAVGPAKRRKVARVTSRKVMPDVSVKLKAVDVTSDDLRQNKYDQEEFDKPPRYVGRPPRGHGPPIDRWPI